MTSQFKNSYEVKLILVEFTSISSTNDRVQGFIDALKKSNQNYKIIDHFKRC